jgi:16S rRNA G1207 methylase RsmC
MERRGHDRPNLLAIAAARKTSTSSIKKHPGISGTCILVYLIRYDVIISNPPFHRQGHRLPDSSALIAQAIDHLLPGDKLILVANNLGYASGTSSSVIVLSL